MLWFSQKKYKMLQKLFGVMIIENISSNLRRVVWSAAAHEFTYSLSYKLTTPISRALIGQHFLLTECAVTHLENVRQTNIRVHKKLAFQLSHLLIPYAIWLFIILGWVVQDILLISVSEGKNYWDIRARG